MANKMRNLSDRPPEERVEIARMGGIASGESRRRSASLREAAQRILKKDKFICTPDEVLEELRAAGMENATSAEAIAVSAVIRALRGDVEAMRFVRDTVGEGPKNRVELSGDPSRPISALDLRCLTDAQLLEIIERAEDNGDE